MMWAGLGFFHFARRYSGNARNLTVCEASSPAHEEIPWYWSLFLQVLRCFNSLGSLPSITLRVLWVYQRGFPHSDIAGSKLARQLPDAYRSRTTSFIAFISQGIHRTPLDFPDGKSNNRVVCFFGVYALTIHDIL